MTAPTKSTGQFSVYRDMRLTVATVNWRLLSNNNREMGRGGGRFATSEECWSAVHQLLEVHAQLTTQLTCTDERWRWRLIDANQEVLAISGHSFDRRLRCERGVVAFNNALAHASLKNGTAATTGGHQLPRGRQSAAGNDALRLVVARTTRRAL